MEIAIAALLALALGLWGGKAASDEEHEEKARVEERTQVEKLGPKQCAVMCESVASYDEYKKRCICK